MIFELAFLWASVWAVVTIAAFVSKVRVAGVFGGLILLMLSVFVFVNDIQIEAGFIETKTTTGGQSNTWANFNVTSASNASEKVNVTGITTITDGRIYSTTHEKRYLNLSQMDETYLFGSDNYVPIIPFKTINAFFIFTIALSQMVWFGFLAKDNDDLV